MKLRLALLVAACAVAVAVATEKGASPVWHARSDVGDPNRFIVHFKEGHNGRRLGASDRRSIATRYGATVVDDNDHFRETVVVASRSARNRLRRDSTVAYLEQDKPRFMLGSARETQQIAADAIANWGLDSQGGYRQLDDPVTVCIIDSGVDIDHEDLDASTIDGADTISSSGVFPWDQDTCDHGTHVSGTVAAVNNNGLGTSGMANLNLFQVRVFSNCGWIYSSGLTFAIERCVAAGARVVSMSLGGGGSTNAEREAIDEAIAAGAIMVAASGNSGGNDLSYPASYPNVVSVGAVDSNFNIASFSTHNALVDISAPGVGIPSTVAGDQYEFFSGTSMATPHVAACAGILLSLFPQATNTDVEGAMTSTAIDLGATGFDNFHGNGFLDCPAAVDALSGGACSRTEPSLGVSLPSECVDSTSTVTVTDEDTGCQGSRTYHLRATTSDPALATVSFPSGDAVATGTVRVEILSDGYPFELTFTIRDSDTKAILHAQEFGSGSNSAKTFDVPITTGSDLLVYCTDSYGDGFLGSGSFAVSVVGSGNSPVIVDGNFGFLEIVTLPLSHFTPTDNMAWLGAGSSGSRSEQLSVDFVDDAEGPVSITLEAVGTGGHVLSTTTVDFDCVAGPPPDPPAAPSSVSSAHTANTPYSVTVTWSPPVDNSQDGYTLNRYLNGNLDDTITLESSSITQYVDDNLPAATDVTYNLQAYNAGGSSPVSATTAALTTAPTTPQNLRVTSKTTTTATLEWDTHPGPMLLLYRTETGGAMTMVASLTSQDVSFVDTSLTPDQEYTWTLSASNGQQSPPSAAVTATTLPLPPGEPTAVTATATGPTTIVVTWQAPLAVLSYNVEVTGPGGVEVLPTTGSPFTYTAEPASSYSIRVQTENEGGTSDFSAAVTADTPDVCLANPPSLPTPQTAFADCTQDGGSTVAAIQLLNNDRTACEAAEFSIAATSDVVDLAFTNGELIEGGGSGVDSVTVSIFADRFPAETRWSIRRASDNSLVTGPIRPRRKLRLSTWTVSLDTSDSYVFEITDSYGDGICCSYGEGYYFVTRDSDGEELFRGGEFASVMTHDITFQSGGTGPAGSRITQSVAPGETLDAVLTVTFPTAQAVGFQATVDLVAGHGTSEEVTNTLLVECQPPAPPAAPVLTAAPDAASSWDTVALQWADVEGETSYEVEYQVDGGDGTWTSTGPALPPGSTSLSVTGLSPTTTYNFRIAAFAGSVSSEYGTASATTTVEPPPTPEAFSAALFGFTEVDLAWTVPAGTVDSVTIERKVDDGAWAVLTDPPLAADATSYRDSGLSRSTAYTYRAFTTNALRDSDPTDEAAVVTPPDAPATPVVSAAALTASSWDTVVVMWVSVVGATEYTVEYKTEAETEWTAVSGSFMADATMATVSGLSSNTAYNFRVAASNAGGSSDFGSASASTTVTPPPTPEQLEAVLDGDSTAVLSWTLPAGVINAVVLERRIGTGEWAVLEAALPSDTVTYRDEGLAADTSHTYRVSTTNDLGTSSASNTATIVTPPVCIPGGFTLTDLTFEQDADTDVRCGKDITVTVTARLTNQDSEVCGASTAEVALSSTPTGMQQCHLVEVDVIPDDFGSEFSFSFTPGGAAAPSLAGGDRPASARVCSSTDQATFAVADSFGDGICCSSGEGSFSLAVDGDLVVDVSGTDASFGASATYPVTLPRSKSLSIAPGASTVVSFTLSARGLASPPAGDYVFQATQSRASDGGTSSATSDALPSALTCTQA